MENIELVKRENEMIPGRETAVYDRSEIPREPQLVSINDVEALKKKYGQDLWQIIVTVDEDDNTEGRQLGFIFRKPNNATFNRYLKNTSKNPSNAMIIFTADNIIEEQREEYERYTGRYPGLALNIGQKLFSVLGMGDNVNFKKL